MKKSNRINRKKNKSVQTELATTTVRKNSELCRQMKNKNGAGGHVSINGVAHFP